MTRKYTSANLVNLREVSIQYKTVPTDHHIMNVFTQLRLKKATEIDVREFNLYTYYGPGIDKGK